VTLQHKGGARVPGPLGNSPGVAGGRLPGPLAFRHVLVAAPGAVAGVAKALKMPEPAADGATKVASAMNWALFRKGGPAVVDIEQSAHLTNCPIPSILAALAHTDIGRKHIQAMVVEYPGSVVTDVSAVVGELATAPPGNKIATNRYFTVTLGKAPNRKPFDVSDVLYTDESADPNPIYMQSPKKALWACMIEKAYALREVSYHKFQELDWQQNAKITANEFWRVLLGSEPNVLAVTNKTDLADIRKAAAAATKVPTIGATKPADEQGAKKVGGYHGFAMLGIQGSTIELYDPALAKTLEISVENFRKDFLAIFSGNP
jgi:hypothetical protein